MLDYSPRARYKVVSNLVVPRRNRGRGAIIVVDREVTSDASLAFIDIETRTDSINAAL